MSAPIPDDVPVLIVGRSLSNYRTRGQAVEPNFTVHACSLCRDEVALSPDGVARLATYAPRAKVLCTVCALVLTAAHPGVELHDTPNSLKQTARSADARSVRDLFNEVAKKKGGG